MLVLPRHNAAGMLARHMRCFTEDSLELLGKSALSQHIRCLGNLAAAAIPEQLTETQIHKKRHNSEPQSPDRDLMPRKPDDLMVPPSQSVSIAPTYYMNGQNQDLHRFLEEVGTNPKEARYWLKQFRRNTEPLNIFAVVQVDEAVLESPELLDSLASSIAFLQRNSMKCVLVHGYNLPDDVLINESILKEIRRKMALHTMNLVTVLENHHAPARPMFAGTNLIRAEQKDSYNLLGRLTGISLDAIAWSLQTNHIPVLQCIGESSTGQLLGVDMTDVTSGLARAMKPLKVMWLNTHGGFTDERGDVIANLNFPADIESLSKKSWCSSEMIEKMDYISDLLQDLPQQSSVVITSADNVLSELFTHRGSGTFFKITEPLCVYHSLDEIDTKRLRLLLNRSFGRDLKEDYFEQLKSKLHTLYLSEGYNAAAIITTEEGCEHPYLDKFAVSLAKQGEGFADLIWAAIKQDFTSLFWRSKGTNVANAWYFKRSEGSWSNGKWIVFWYGVKSHRESSQLVDHALDLSQSFADPARERKATSTEVPQT